MPSSYLLAADGNVLASHFGFKMADARRVRARHSGRARGSNANEPLINAWRAVS